MSNKVVCIGVSVHGPVLCTHIQLWVDWQQKAAWEFAVKGPQLDTTKQSETTCLLINESLIQKGKTKPKPHKCSSNINPKNKI